MGDVVVTCDPQMRQYYVGIVRSDAEIQMTVWRDGREERGYVRSVECAHIVSRDCLSTTTRKRLNRGFSCFKVSAEVRREIIQLCSRCLG